MPSSADPAEPTERIGCELTRTNLGESAITLDTLGDPWLPFDNAPQGRSTEWTNEKHDTYLGYLEASFVRELYHSMQSDGRDTKKNSRMPFSSDQMVLGHEFQKNINRDMNEPLLDSTADSHGAVESLRFHHFTHSGKCRSDACSEAEEHDTTKNNGSHSRRKPTCLYGSTRNLGRRALVCSAQEVSDQNFVGDIPEGKSSCKSTTKRLKTANWLLQKR